MHPKLEAAVIKELSTRLEVLKQKEPLTFGYFIKTKEEIDQLITSWYENLAAEGILFVALSIDMDMHDVGDKLLKRGFKDPVLDVEYFFLPQEDDLIESFEVIFIYALKGQPKAPAQTGTIKIAVSDIKRKQTNDEIK